MQLQLIFKKLEDNLLNAIAVVRLVDTQEADAPAHVISTFVSDHFDVLSNSPVVRINAVFENLHDRADLSVSVKVEGRVGIHAHVTFINTAEVTLQMIEHGCLSISLEQI